MRRQVLSLLVENNPGVTSHISGLFSRRGYNIDSFSSGVTADPRYTRITIVASGDEQILEQIEKQLAKLEDVVEIKKLEPGSSVTRELILVKIRAKDTERQPILNVTEIFHGKIVDFSACFALEVCMHRCISVETGIPFINGQHPGSSMFYKQLQRIVYGCF